MNGPDAAPATQFAPLWRRLAAGLYDLLPLAAVVMVGTALLFPFTRGGIEAGTAWYQAWLVLLAFAYYGYSWRRGGATIGMRAWRLRVHSADGGELPWGTVALRFVIALLSVAALGAGLLAALFDARRRMWHDRAADTIVVVIAKRR
ncbi:MAG TPA: RDD family protein [Candidatus Saccharimonadia bacterium]|nr:RDD family protein [Candidatus Saccharimonadia bacterium]